MSGPRVLIVGAGPLAAAYERGLVHEGIAHERIEVSASHPLFAEVLLGAVRKRTADVIVTLPAVEGELWWTPMLLDNGFACYEGESPLRTAAEIESLAARASRHSTVVGIGPDTFLGSTVIAGARVVDEEPFGAVRSAVAGIGTSDTAASARSVVDAVTVLFDGISAIEPPEPSDAAEVVGAFRTGRGVRVTVRLGEDDEHQRGVLLLQAERAQVKLSGLRHYDRPVRVLHEGRSEWEEADLGVPPVTDQAGALFRGPGVRELIRGGLHGHSRVAAEQCARSMRQGEELLALLGSRGRSGGEERGRR